MMERGFLLVIPWLLELLTLHPHYVYGKTLTCEKAQQACQTSPTCGLQLHNAMIKCENRYADNSGPAAASDDPSSDITICSDQCQISLLELERGTIAGRDYARCSCNFTTSEDINYCQGRKAIFSCRRESPSQDPEALLESQVPGHLYGCNAARRLCADNMVCRDALHYYEMVCEKSQTEAPDRNCPSLHCLESYEILMRQEEAQFLRGCHCNVITPDPNVIYCFKHDFFKRCSLADVTELDDRFSSSPATSGVSRQCLFRSRFFAFTVLLFFVERGRAM